MIYAKTANLYINNKIKTKNKTKNLHILYFSIYLPTYLFYKSKRK